MGSLVPPVVGLPWGPLPVGHAPSKGGAQEASQQDARTNSTEAKKKWLYSEHPAKVEPSHPAAETHLDRLYIALSVTTHSSWP